MNKPADEPPRPIEEARYRNYLELRRRFREMEGATEPQRGEMLRFGAKVGIAAKYLSNIHHRRKPIGKNIAKKLEDGFNLPDGWLDIDRAEGALLLDDKAREFSALALRLYMKDPEGTHAALVRYMEEKLLGK